MNSLTYILPHDSVSVTNNFSFEKIDLQKIDKFTNDVDFIPFDGVRVSTLSDSECAKVFLESLKNHPNYKISKNNKQIPIVFFHEHEALNYYDFLCLIRLTSNELGVDSKKIILIDTNLVKREGFINQPLYLKIKQFNLKVNENSIEKNKKFTFLTNRANKLRFEVFDKVLKNYESNIDKIKDENIITFRNYKNDIKTTSSDINNILDFVKYSNYYKFYNNFDFYKKINLPWIVDDFSVGGTYQVMFEKQNQIYGQSFFSIIIETDWNGYDLDKERYDKNFLPFSEKTLKPICSNNLPFIVHSKEYYKEFENIGFDFSYLKKIFDIDYKNNNLKQNFDSLDKFLSYFKNNDLNTIKKEYESVYDIVEHNKSILKKIENNELNDDICEFVQKIKKEKYD